MVASAEKELCYTEDDGIAANWTRESMGPEQKANVLKFSSNPPARETQDSAPIEVTQFLTFLEDLVDFEWRRHRKKDVSHPPSQPSIASLASLRQPGSLPPLTIENTDQKPDPGPSTCLQRKGVR